MSLVYRFILCHCLCCRLCGSLSAQFVTQLLARYALKLETVLCLLFKPCELKRKTQFPHVLQEDSEIKQLTESLTLCIYVSIWNLYFTVY